MKSTPIRVKDKLIRKSVCGNNSNMYLRATEEMIRKQRRAFRCGSVRNITPTFRCGGGGVRKFVGEDEEVPLFAF